MSARVLRGAPAPAPAARGVPPGLATADDCRCRDAAVPLKYDGAGEADTGSPALAPTALRPGTEAMADVVGVPLAAAEAAANDDAEAVGVTNGTRRVGRSAATDNLRGGGGGGGGGGEGDGLRRPAEAKVGAAYDDTRRGAGASAAFEAGVRRGDAAVTKAPSAALAVCAAAAAAAAAGARAGLGTGG